MILRMLLISLKAAIWSWTVAAEVGGGLELHAAAQRAEPVTTWLTLAPLSVRT